MILLLTLLSDEFFKASVKVYIFGPVFFPDMLSKHRDSGVAFCQSLICTIWSAVLTRFWRKHSKGLRHLRFGIPTVR